jgi:hypothetical protein
VAVRMPSLAWLRMMFIAMDVLPAPFLPMTDRHCAPDALKSVLVCSTK